MCIRDRKKGEREFSVVIEAGDEASGTDGQVSVSVPEEETEMLSCAPDGKSNGLVIVLSSNQMGSGDEVLGKLLMKGFVYAAVSYTHLDVYKRQIYNYSRKR